MLVVVAPVPACVCVSTLWLDGRGSSSIKGACCVVSCTLIVGWDGVAAVNDAALFPPSCI